MELCRACAGPAVPGISLENPSFVKFKAVILKLETRISGSLLLPNIICMSCKEMINSWVLFQEKCSESHNKFINILQENKSPSSTIQSDKKETRNKNILNQTCSRSSSSNTFLDKWLQRNPENHNKVLNNVENISEKDKSLVVKYNCKELRVGIERLSDKIIDKFTSKSKVPSDAKSLQESEKRKSSTIHTLLQFRNLFSSKNGKEKEETIPKPLVPNSICIPHDVTKEQYSDIQCNTDQTAGENDSTDELDNEIVADSCEDESDTRGSEIKLKNYEYFSHNVNCESAKCENNLTKQNKNENKINNETNNYYKCNICFKIFQNNFELDYHLKKAHNQKNLFVCHICMHHFKSKKVIYLHIQNSHLNQTYFNCNFCSKKYKTKKILSDHIKYKHSPINNKTYECDECKQSFIKKSYVRNHILQIHSNLRSHICTICKKAFNNISILKRHHLCHSNLRLHSCNLCDMTYKCRRTLKAHQKVHTTRVPVICKICEKSFICDSSLRRHMLKKHTFSTSSKIYKCEICSKKYDTYGNLNSHKLFKHDDLYNYPCKQCSSKFKTKTHLTRHEQTMHGNSNCTVFKCKDCTKEFKTEYNLKLHSRRMHTTVRPYKCKECEKSFKTRGELTYHIKRMHTNIRPHKCSICTKTFLTKSDLTVHINVHNNLHNYKCDKCPCTFNAASNLRVHKIRHHNVVKSIRNIVNSSKTKSTIEYSCYHCTYKSSFKTNLTRHLENHCEKYLENSCKDLYELKYSYKCTKCTDQFWHRNYLVQHLMKAHKIKYKYKCEKCTNSFNNTTTLSYHYKKVHNANYISKKCNICLECFKSKGELLKHKFKMHSSAFPFQCINCDKAFKFEKSLKYHLFQCSKVHATVAI